MPRSNPHRITRRKLLKFTGQQADVKHILSRLEHHQKLLDKLHRAGVDAGLINEPKKTVQVPELLNPEDLQDGL